MGTFLVTRDVLIDEETIAPVHFTIEAVNGPTAARHADNGKRDMEADNGLAPARNVKREGKVGDHLYTLPFAGLSDVLFPGRKANGSKRSKGRKRNRNK